MLEDRGLNAEIRYYLESPPTADEIRDLLVALGESNPAVLIRQKEDLWTELSLADASAEEKIQAIVKYPELFNRPVLVVGEKAVVARPVDLVLPLLENA